MTIVLASIADKGNAIIMASDRMLSMPELTYQFEHYSMKIRRIGNYLVGYAGTTTFADDILSHDYGQINTIKEFTKQLSEFYIKYGNRIAERVLLESLGIDLQTFNSNPQNFPDSIRERVYQQLGEEKLNVDFIVCGFDKDQPKIYNVGQYGIYSTSHSIGYSAIGIGETHASSFYMVNGFTFNTPLKEAVFFAFRAKKSAEIAAGVGKCTDICILEKTKEPIFFKDGCDFIANMNNIYERFQKKQKGLYQRDIVPELDKLQWEVSNEDK
jgi:20S proteasome alpha/beta subunit